MEWYWCVLVFLLVKLDGFLDARLIFINDFGWIYKNVEYVFSFVSSWNTNQGVWKYSKVSSIKRITVMKVKYYHFDR